jgi:long-chain acyl-CoA synthetase
MPNLALALVEAARIYPDRVAVRQDDIVLTYTELDERTAEVAGWAALNGVRPGDGVGVMMPNVAEFAVVYYGLLRAGAVIVPINPLLRGREVEHYLNDSGARTIVAWHDAEGAAEGAAATGARLVTVGGSASEFGGAKPQPIVVARAAEETAVILYTSGTTGTPKGAELTHENLRRNAALSATGLLGLEADDVILGCLPLFHSFGQTCALNAAIASGASITLMPRFDARRALEIIERDAVTVFAGVPTMYVALANYAKTIGPDARSTAATLRTCLSGGAALPVEVMHSFEAALGCEILEGYGLSETSPVASFNQRGNRREGSIGLPVEGIQMQVIDTEGNEVSLGAVGEIAIKGHNIMKGYWQRPDATEAAIVDGWFRSGDLGRQDEDGFFYIVDRKKDMIIRGGFNVYPREIEEVLYEHPHIVEAAVIGIPHETHGEEVAAAVAIAPGAAVTAADIRDYVKERVAPYKYPRHVWLVDALPKGATGKVLKRAITIPQEIQS